MRKALILGVAGAMVVSVPAVAKPGTHPSGTHGKSHRCTAHKVAYVAGGTLSSFTDNGDGTYTVVVNVTRANHHAKAVKGGTLTETVPADEVKFGDGVTSTTTSSTDKVQVIGKITSVAKRCSDQSAAGVITIKKIVIDAPSTSSGA